jgi:hypothetical protein
MRTFAAPVGLGFGTSGGGGSQPDAPVLNSVVDDGNQDSATANVTGTGTVRLYYRLRYAPTWTAGQTRSGSGDITQTGLTAGLRYEFFATDTVASVESHPSNVLVLKIEATGTTDDIFENARDIFDTFIEDGPGESLTVKRRVNTYDTRLEASTTWSTIGTFIGDWQPLPGSAITQEYGLENKSDAQILGPYDVDIQGGDRVYRSDGTYEYVNYVKKHGIHVFIRLTKVDIGNA